MTRSRKTSGFVLRIFCAMLLVVLGFSHKPVAMAADQPVNLANYVLPDGSIASLCLADQDGKQGKHVDYGCDACRIASIVLMPAPPAEGEDISRSVATIAFVFAPEAFHRLNFPPNAPPRGPPAVLFSFETA